MRKNEEIYVNRQYKDRLFKFIFRAKKDLLELYNAVNDTNYTDPEEMEINTLEDVVYMGMKNDTSFLIKDVLNLYEHQSTFSPNLPLRGLFYFTKLYQRIVGNQKDIYSSRIIELPYPQFIVFYNGTKEEPERQVLQLNTAYPPGFDKENAALQCRAVVININLGYNSSIMNKCKRLEEYAQFIAIIRGYLEKKYSIEEAVTVAMDECIKKGILEEILRNHREEVRSMVLTEYDEQAHIKNEREIAHEEGRRVGHEEGRRVGHEEGEERVLRLMKLLVETERASEISRVTVDEEYRKQLYEEFQID